MNFFRTLFADRKGVAAIEFAFVSVFLFGTLMVALDFGFYTQQKLKLGSSVEQAAILAYNQQVGASTAVIKSYIETYSGLKNAPTATITCNGTAVTDVCGDGRCSCITAAGGFTITTNCNIACPTGAAVSGNYLRISATATYNSVIVPDKYLNGGQMTQVAVVRLQ
jgi:Flp pilus assembly protein TadG